ncbi:MAG: type II secretion system F family protein [Bryobacteraceae bacterium]
MAIVIIVFVLVFVAALFAVGAGLSFVKSRQKQHIRSMLRTAEHTPRVHRTPAAELLRPPDPEDWLRKLFARFRFMQRLELILEQSGKNWTGGKLIALSLAAAVVGFLIGLKLPLAIPAALAAPAAALIAGSLPFLTVWRQRAKNIAAFEKQFPEALDFLARSMRAGHAFSIALEMLGADSPEPVASAFRRVSNDLKLGASLEAALKKLMVIIPLLDVRFFVSSVLLQQDTGGNLGEILNKLAHVIRERFRLKGAVKAASAHGRITGLVLFLMPVAVTLLLMVTSPAYLKQLWADPAGRMMAYAAMGGQVVGYFVIQKIVNIKV